MAGLAGLAEKMKDYGVFRNVQIEVDLHAPVVGMARHGVPKRALRQFGKSMTSWQLFITLGWMNW